MAQIFLNQLSSSLSSGSITDTNMYLLIDNQSGSTDTGSYKLEPGELKGYVLGEKASPTGDFVGSTDKQTVTNKRFDDFKLNSSVTCSITSEELNTLHGANVSASIFNSLGLVETIGGTGSYDIPTYSQVAPIVHTHTTSSLTDYTYTSMDDLVTQLATLDTNAKKVIDGFTVALAGSKEFAYNFATFWSASSV